MDELPVILAPPLDTVNPLDVDNVPVTDELPVTSTPPLDTFKEPANVVDEFDAVVPVENVAIVYGIEKLVPCIKKFFAPVLSVNDKLALAPVPR
jgi:hypothetical protein